MNMTLRSAFLSLLIATPVALGSVSSAGTRTEPSNIRSKHAFLKIPRGGAGPLDPLATAKVATVLASAQGLLMNVAPEAHLEGYGMDISKLQDVKASKFSVEYNGFALLSIGALGYCLFYQKTSLQTAVAASMVMWIYHTLKNTFGGSAVESGAFKNTKGLNFALAVFLFTVYAMTQDYADLFLKATSLFWGLSGLHTIVAPDSAAEVWASAKKNKVDPYLDASLRFFGYFLVSFAAITGSIVFCGASNTQAFGYGQVIWALHGLSGILTGEAEKIGSNNIFYIPWVLFHLVSAYTQLL